VTRFSGKKQKKTEEKRAENETKRKKNTFKHLKMINHELFLL
jgi:hypothetical protein